MTEREQVILRAIAHVGHGGPAEISKVIRAVGYPKATTKKTLIELAVQGIVFLHRHDYPGSLAPADRKMMVNWKGSYYNAVSARKKNPIRRSMPKTSRDRVLKDLLFDYWSTLDLRAATLDAMRSTRKRLAMLRKEGAGRDRIAEAVKQEHAEHAHVKDLDRKIAQRKKLAVTRMAQLKRERNPKKKIQYVRWAVDYINPLYVYIKYEPDLMDMAMARRDAYSALTGEFGAHTHNPWRLIGEPKILNKLPAGVDGIKGSTTKGEYWAWIGLRKKQNPIRNPKGQHLPGLPKKAQREYEHVLKTELAMGRSVKRAKQIAAGKVKKDYSAKKNTTVIKAKRVVIRKVVNAKKKAKPKRNASRPQHSKSSKASRAGASRASRKASKSKSVAKRNAGTLKKLAAKAVKTVKRAIKRNISEGFYDAAGVFHPIRSATDYSRATAGETGGKAKHTRSRKKLASKRKASATARHRSTVEGRKATASRLAGRAIKKSSGLLKKRGQRNPSPATIRKQFAGRYTKNESLMFPDGTPQGLAKLGRLVSITTDEGRIAPVSGVAWLCSDTHGKLHIGTPTKGHVLFGGPAHNYGHVREIEYEESKPHLGYTKKTLFFHKLGEVTGVKPRLMTDGKGGAKFVGGAYKIKREGIIN